MRFSSMRMLARRCLPLLALIFIASCGGGGHDDLPFSFTTTLSGAEEVPAVSSAGSGAGIVTVDTDGKTLLASVVVFGINDTNAWLQEGEPGSNGPVILALAKEAASGAWTASASVSDAQLDALRAGRYYFNVGSSAHPAGELRGQIFEQLPSSQELQLMQQARAQSALIDRQLQLIQRIEDDLDRPRSGVGVGIGIGF